MILHQSTPLTYEHVQDLADEAGQQRISDNYVRVNIGMSSCPYCSCLLGEVGRYGNCEMDEGNELDRDRA